MDIININETFEDNLFFIGGVVRDEILGCKSFDIDITYIGNAIEYCSRFGQVIRENPDFGTVRVMVDEDYKSYFQLKDNAVVDFASTRSETYPKKGHLPCVNKIGCSLKEDILRRDFTINAIAKSVKTGEIVDYTNGLEDIKNKKIRVLHDNSFVDDPTRIIRGLKFSVRFGFELEKHTKELQNRYLSDVNYDMSYKRLKKELIETFNLNSQIAFEKFINEKIYKLITKDNIILPDINVEDIVNKYIKAGFFESVEHIWIIYVGILDEISKLPLTKYEQRIIDLVPDIEAGSDFEIYKAFKNIPIESVLLYGIRKNLKIAEYYLDNLSGINIEITGDDLVKLGIKPSFEYKIIFDEILKEKIKHPFMTKDDEIIYAKKIVRCLTNSYPKQ